MRALSRPARSAGFLRHFGAYTYIYIYVTPYMLGYVYIHPSHLYIYTANQLITYQLHFQRGIIIKKIKETLYYEFLNLNNRHDWPFVEAAADT